MKHSVKMRVSLRMRLGIAGAVALGMVTVGTAMTGGTSFLTGQVQPNPPPTTVPPTGNICNQINSQPTACKQCLLIECKKNPANPYQVCPQCVPPPSSTKICTDAVLKAHPSEMSSPNAACRNCVQTECTKNPNDATAWLTCQPSCNPQCMAKGNGTAACVSCLMPACASNPQTAIAACDLQCVNNPKNNCINSTRKLYAKDLWNADPTGCDACIMTQCANGSTATAMTSCKTACTAGRASCPNQGNQSQACKDCLTPICQKAKSPASALGSCSSKCVTKTAAPAPSCTAQGNQTTACRTCLTSYCKGKSPTYALNACDKQCKVVTKTDQAAACKTETRTGYANVGIDVNGTACNSCIESQCDAYRSSFFVRTKCTNSCASSCTSQGNQTQSCKSCLSTFCMTMPPAGALSLCNNRCDPGLITSCRQKVQQTFATNPNNTDPSGCAACIDAECAKNPDQRAASLACGSACTAGMTSCTSQGNQTAACKSCLTNQCRYNPANAMNTCYTACEDKNDPIVACVISARKYSNGMPVPSVCTDCLKTQCAAGTTSQTAWRECAPSCNAQCVTMSNQQLQAKGVDITTPYCQPCVNSMCSMMPLGYSGYGWADSVVTYCEAACRYVAP